MTAWDEMRKISPLRIYLWAIGNDPEFKLCKINLPLRLKAASSVRSDSRVFAIELHLQKPGIYIPWAVRERYAEKVLGLKSEFDDIPF